jgi:gas vesicle protein
MIFIIPFIIGAIGVAVGAVGGAFAAHAAGEKDRQESKSHRQINNDLVVKYSELQKRYYELGDKSKAESKRLMKKLAKSEIEKDTLHLVVELQQAVIGLMLSIDESPSYEALTQIHIAVKATNQVLFGLDKSPIEISADYFDRNFKRVISIEGSNIRELIAKDPNTPPATLVKLSKDLFWIREAVADNPSTPTNILTLLKKDGCSEVSIAAERSLNHQKRLHLSVKYGSQVSIKACNGKYIMARLNYHGKLAARADHINEWERFEIVNAEESLSENKNRPVRYGEKIAFRSIANDKFVSSDLGNHGKLVARANKLIEYEIFTLLSVENHKKLDKNIEYEEKFSLQVHNTKQVYCRVKDDGRICIDSNRTDGSEVFTFVKPSN